MGHHNARQTICGDVKKIEILYTQNYGKKQIITHSIQLRLRFFVLFVLGIHLLTLICQETVSNHKGVRRYCLRRNLNFLPTTVRAMHTLCWFLLYIVVCMYVLLGYFLHKIKYRTYQLTYKEAGRYRTWCQRGNAVNPFIWS